MREVTAGLGPGVAKDFATSIGPALVTPDEISVQEIALEARLNGEVWSSGTLGAMQFSFDAVIAHLSCEQTLHPGDVIGSGTRAEGAGWNSTCGSRVATSSRSKPRASESCATGSYGTSSSS
jgi:2-keto-4-pentenoate hydratase/2-oxohepta-3-ene-1,7-dioic acid hydratase in catechol pathway